MAPSSFNKPPFSSHTNNPHSDEPEPFGTRHTSIIESNKQKETFTTLQKAFSEIVDTFPLFLLPSARQKEGAPIADRLLPSLEKEAHFWENQIEPFQKAVEEIIEQLGGIPTHSAKPKEEVSLSVLEVLSLIQEL